MVLEELFDVAEKVVEGVEGIESLEKFPEEAEPLRKPFENPFRRSALIVSGDRPRHLKKVFLREADVIIFNVEDGVAESNKKFARLLLKKFLKNVPFDGNKEVVIRINPLDSAFFWEDVLELLPVVPHAIRLSKVEKPEDVVVLDGIMKAYELSAGLPEKSIKIQLSIETGKAVERLSEILSASERINAAYLGILDLFADLGLSQELTKSSPLATYLKSKFVSTCRAFNVSPIAPAYQDYADLEGFEKEALEEKELGFAGKMCISVKQVGIANRVFSPTEEEIEEAKRIVALYERALKEGRGGITYNGKFIDQPIYRDAINKLKFLGI
ncbi:HpcH/HpaI aldolase/citrate lyase family protein [Phorcysia thermohydrogeniphila]|uniref:Citrate lyase subunit beta/citryl-CoA lyase n=1 Tax=Phorcysia thermohydrogeniphila TaxID=936138 RepID=A0A4R1G8U8_9BACT|nr:CoA ester lyase [Phorcysia thermohydrogeniphila]TCK02895.1 citrate lyase subunit beta/citryl-CoA lyase [Phorcysia thermohydrogeniphila]